MSYYTPTTTDDTPYEKVVAQITQLVADSWELAHDDATQAHQLAHEAYTLFHTLPLEQQTPELLATTLVSLAQSDLMLAHYFLALGRAWEAAPILEKDPDNVWLLRLYTTLSTCYFQLGDYSEALELLFKRFHASERQGDLLEKARALMALGALYATIEENEKALAYLEESLPVFEALHESYWVTLTFTNMADVYKQMGEYDTAVAYAFKSLTYLREKRNHPRIELFTLYTLGSIYRQADELALARQYLQESITLARDFDQPEWEIDSLQELGQLYLQNGHLDTAVEALQMALLPAQSAGLLPAQVEIHQALAQTFQQLGNFELALTHHQTFHELKEQLFSTQTDQKIRNLEVLHRTQVAQKEAELYASLYREEQAHRQLTETMLDIGLLLAGSLDLDQVLDQILEQLSNVVAFDRAVLLLHENQLLSFAAGRGFPPDFEPTQVRLNVNDYGLLRQMYDDPQPEAIQRIANIENWPTFNQLVVPGAWLGIPLVHQRQFLGLLSVARMEEEPFDSQAVTLASMFAMQAAVALTNARLYDQVNDFNQELQAEVARQTVALREAYHQLERLEKTKSDFIAVTAHEMRTPLTVIKSYAQLLQKDAHVQGQERLGRLVGGVLNGMERLHDIVNTMLLMAKIDTRQLKLHMEAVNLGELLTTLMAGLQTAVAEREQELILADEVRQLPPVQGDQELLALVFNHLLENGIKYTPDGGRIEVQARPWHPSDPDDFLSEAVEIIIRDTGIGIQPEALELIFQKFYQTGEISRHSSGKTKFQAGGPGLGLAIARGIITAHRGRLWATSPGHDHERHPGSTFHVLLPWQQPHVV